MDCLLYYYCRTDFLFDLLFPTFFFFNDYRFGRDEGPPAEIVGTFMMCDYMIGLC
jgi:hypothetical protein